MGNQTPQHALLGVDFLKKIGGEAEVLSTKAGLLLDDVDEIPILSALSQELMLMSVSLQSLGELCENILKTCAIEEGIVKVPPDQFLSITDASRIGVGAYKEALRYISFEDH
tara:strand:- start:610 stop:945 length:336 start_codon:yes stop_codon:yes gene_type:complete